MTRGYIPNSGGSGGGSDEVTATTAQVLSGYTAVTSESDDEPIEGTMKDNSGAYRVATSVTEKSDHSTIYMRVPENAYYNTNAYLQSASSNFGNASADQVLKDRTFTSSAGLNVNGTIDSKGATTYNVSTSAQTITKGQYLSGDQTIRAVTTSNISAGNIKKGVVVKVGDADNAGRIHDVTGTYTTVSSGQSAVVAGALRSGYSGFANGGAEVKGSIASLAGGTYKSTTSNQTISCSGKYMTSNIVITGDGNLVAGNILSGKSILGVSGNVIKYGVYKNGNAKAQTAQSLQASTWTASGSYSARTFYVHNATNLGFNPVYGYGNITDKNDNYVFRVNWSNLCMSVGTASSNSYNVQCTWSKTSCVFPFKTSQSATGCNCCGYY